MTDTPRRMRGKLGVWNDGTGIDLAGWITGSGNFELAVAYSTVFWPKFRAVDKYILRGVGTLEQIRD